MIFREDWFTQNIPYWETYVLPYLVEHPARFLEVGSFEGRSAAWLLNNALTENRDRITCVDWFDAEYEQRFDHNMNEINAGARLDKRKGPSHEILRKLPLESYDGCYVDASHYTCDVLRDAVLCFDLVRVGGVIVFDDYLFKPDDAQQPQIAIDAFLNVYGNHVKVLHHAWQVIVKRIL